MTVALAREASGVASTVGAAAFGRARLLEQSVEVEPGRLAVVLDAEKLCGLLGLGQRARDDDGDGLAVEEDVVVLKDVDVARDGELWRIERSDDRVDT